MVIDALGHARGASVNLLVVSGSGLLGLEITRQARLARDNVVATYRSRLPAVPGVDWLSLDVRQRDDVVALATEAEPDVIINGR